MSAFMSDNLLKGLNWTGQGEKMAFGELKSADIVRSKYMLMFVGPLHLLFYIRVLF